MNLAEALEYVKAEGNVIKVHTGKLPDQTFKELNTIIVNAGGKWKGGKVFGWEFKVHTAQQVANIAEQIKAGETPNFKKKLQFYHTTRPAQDFAFQYVNIRDKMRILEPEAGEGDLLNRIFEEIKLSDARRVTVDYVEISDVNCNTLRKKGYTDVIEMDFLKYEPGKLYDLIIANPPFTNGADVDHVMKMYSLLDDWGEIVTFMSTGWKDRDDNKSKAFREWLKYTVVHYDEIECPRNLFKGNGANANTVLLVISNPA